MKEIDKKGLKLDSLVVLDFSSTFFKLFVLFLFFIVSIIIILFHLESMSYHNIFLFVLFICVFVLDIQYELMVIAVYVINYNYVISICKTYICCCFVDFFYFVIYSHNICLNHISFQRMLIIYLFCLQSVTLLVGRVIWMMETYFILILA